ncbi:MAG: hypothetical protein M1829_002869 [Trizodia sp. TS-e1964]|nr:MAG: hypothetical protein M1829_002869 [Trizodia sp. TS-e1964]
MQKLLRRTALVKAQAQRKLIIKRKKNASDRARSRAADEQYYQRLQQDDIKLARVTRKEDWELGPLAPRRDIGDKRDTYGTMDTSRLMAGKKQAYKKFPTIVKGDRVVIVEGRDKGKIGVVMENKGRLTVEGLNMVDIKVPKWIIEQDTDKRPIRSLEASMPISSVRLVFPLFNRETGLTRDVIVQKVEISGVWYDKLHRTRKYNRIIPGLGIKIPWPAIAPTEHQDHDIDTLRADVETQTFVPTLLRPPMPVSVIDELRNKYSKFRDRHDEEFIQKKIEEDKQRIALKKTDTSMRTPLQDAKKKERKEKKARGKGVLTEQMLIRIGEVMAARNADKTKEILKNKEIPINERGVVPHLKSNVTSSLPVNL